MSKNTISESAFLVNESRLRRVDISQDIYSHLWTTDSTAKLWNDFSNDVYPYDDIELSLRNRFYLENLKSFIKKVSNPVFINFASGFTSYPFLIGSDCNFVEIDIDKIIDYKIEKVKNWMENKILPNRDINFIKADFNEGEDINRVKDFIYSNFKNKVSFILLEGISYYLTKKSLVNIFEMISEFKIKDSVIAIDFWKPEISKNPVFSRFICFFEKRFGFKKTNYNFLTLDFIQKIIGYEIIDFTDIQSLETKYTSDNFLNDDNQILPEFYAVFKK